jgi:tRNA 2-thiouridine synthesizing protein A
VSSIFFSVAAMPNTTHHILDTSGLYCPEPVMLLHNKIRDIHSGELLEVIATDPSTQRDIPKFCNFLGHTLVSQNATADVFTYLIKKA